MENIERGCVILTHPLFFFFLHAACNTKRGGYSGENRYHQLNNHFPSFLFHSREIF